MEWMKEGKNKKKGRTKNKEWEREWERERKRMYMCSLYMNTLPLEDIKILFR